MVGLDPDGPDHARSVMPQGNSHAFILDGVSHIQRQVQETLTVRGSLSAALGPADQSRGWRRRWLEAQRELERLLAPSTEPLSGDAIQAARHRLHSFYVQTYHLKDALKREAASTGVSGATIETTVTNDPDLALLADLANFDKHGNLDAPPRSGHVPAITVVEGRTVDLPSDGWRLYLAVDHAGKVKDGLEIAQAAVAAWQRALAGWGLI